MWKEAYKTQGGHPLHTGNPLSGNQNPKLLTQRLPPRIYDMHTQHQKKEAMRNSLSFLPKETFIDEGGKYLIVTGDINSKPYMLVTLYALNTHQLHFLRVIKKAEVWKLHNMRKL